VEDLGGRGADIEVTVWDGLAIYTTDTIVEALWNSELYILHTSTQVMRTSVASPSADSGRSDTSLRRIKGPSCGGDRAVNCDCGAASAMFQ
jgi:hypothetical protein